MDFTIFVKTGEIYNPASGWDGDEGYDISYTADEEELLDALTNIFFEKEFKWVLKMQNSDFLTKMCKLSINGFIEDVGVKALAHEHYDELLAYFSKHVDFSNF